MNSPTNPKPCPPEGYRLLTDEEKKRPLPRGLIVLAGEAWTPSYYLQNERLEYQDFNSAYAAPTRAPVTAEPKADEPTPEMLEKVVAAVMAEPSQCPVCKSAAAPSVREIWNGICGPGACVVSREYSCPSCGVKFDNLDAWLSAEPKAEPWRLVPDKGGPPSLWVGDKCLLADVSFPDGENLIAQHNASLKQPECAECARKQKDINDLNNLLRAAGWGQGEIDSAVCVEEENEKLRAECARLKAQIHDMRAPQPSFYELADQRDFFRAQLAAETKRREEAERAIDKGAYCRIDKDYWFKINARLTDAEAKLEKLKADVVKVLDMLKGNDPARAPSMWVAEEMLDAALRALASPPTP